MFVCISAHIGVNLGVTDRKGSLLVQQDATVCRAPIQNLFLIRTFWAPITVYRFTAMEIQARKWWLFVDECIFINVCVVFMHVHDGIEAVIVKKTHLGSVTQLCPNTQVSLVTVPSGFRMSSLALSL